MRPVTSCVPLQTFPLVLLKQTRVWSLAGMQVAPGEEVDSASGGATPSDSQPMPPTEPPLCQSWLFVPCTISQRSGLTAGPVPDASFPPREVQVDHAAPFQFLCQTAPSVPRTKTAILPTVHPDVAAGEEVSFPPSDCQLDHDVPVHALCHRAPSVPCTNTSSRPADQEETAGPVPDASCPPRDCQPDHPFW